MRTIIVFLVLFLLFSLPSSIFAHGGPPFVSLNGAKTITNPVFSGSNFFKITYEIAPKDYQLNETIKFDMDTTLLPVDSTQLSQTTFHWNFGDGTQSEGLTTQHAYKKVGTFNLSLQVNDPSTTDPVEIESIKINVLPNTNYSLPKASISVNGKEISDPIKNPVVVKKDEKVTLNANKSKGNLKTYEWDLGDGSKMVTGEKIEHTFDFSGPYSYSYFPVLKVTDENGFTSESTVQVTNQESLQGGSSNSSTSSQTKKQNSWLIYALVGGGVLLAGGGLIFLKKTGKN